MIYRVSNSARTEFHGAPIAARHLTRFALALGFALATSGLFLPAVVRARPDPNASVPAIESDAITFEPRAARVTDLSSSVFQETTSYGGTYWAPDSMRWEALRDSCWTFDTGVGSSINLGGNPNKPVGYHQTMEGWYGIDQTLNPQPFFRRSSTCVINGSFSMWAGLSAAEAAEICWAAGQGYGNSWDLVISKTFQYPGSGNATLSYKYAVDSEPGFDYAYVVIDTTGNGSEDPVPLRFYDGLVSGTASVPLVRGSTMRSTAGPVVIHFLARSDGAYSDEDGMFASTCGLMAVDDIQLTGAITDLATFETSANGWTQSVPTTAIGDLSHLADIGDSPPPATFCPCSVRDSVLVFNNEAGRHPRFQDSIAASPWIDLRRGGDLGRPGRLMIYDVYASLPISEGVFVQIRARYYPYSCPYTGEIRLSPWRDQGTVFYYGESPFCTPPGTPRLRDYSAVIPAGAEQVQISLGVLEGCDFIEFGCTGSTNTTPWLDNISLGIYGSANAPMVSTTALSRFQDNFAADGTIALNTPGRIDVNAVKGGTGPTPLSVLGDTLTASGDGGNTEVRLVFRVRPGPFTNPAALAARASRWTPEPTLTTRYGGMWYSARMDTAQQGTAVPTPGTWMSAFHEEDPGFQGTDTTVDPTDLGPAGGTYRLANDILPDNVFTPGSRIDYFVAARYRPPDPRNPGGATWLTDPDTAQAHFREVEILPSSADSNMTWNCILYVDHHDDREFGDQQLEDAGLDAALGPGFVNAEGTRYDRWDVQSPSSAQLSFARPTGSAYGATLIQARMYQTMAWHSGSLGGAMSALDTGILYDWARSGSSPRRFWGTGDGLVQSLATAGGNASSFLNGVLGATLNCTSIRVANCPSGTPIDTTYCLPTIGVPGAEFTSSIVPRVRSNGCPDLRQYDLLNLTMPAGDAKGQLSYVKAGSPRNYASVTNRLTAPELWSVVDGMGVGRLRTNAGYFGAGCNDVGAAMARADDVLGWLNSLQVCPPGVTGVPDPTVPPAPIPWKAALRAAVPNPWSPDTRIAYVNPVDGGEVDIELFDITGRLVRKLAQGAHAAGPGEVAWDGRTAEGSPAAQGLYFYRMTAGTFSATERLVLIR